MSLFPKNVGLFLHSSPPPLTAVFDLKSDELFPYSSLNLIDLISTENHYYLKNMRMPSANTKATSDKE